MKPKIKDYKIVIQAEQFVSTKKKSKRKLIDFNIEEALIKDFGEDYKEWFQVDFLLKPKVITKDETTTITFKAKATPLPVYLELLERLEFGL